MFQICISLYHNVEVYINKSKISGGKQDNYYEVIEYITKIDITYVGLIIRF